jgi:hypothetical protein
MILIVQSTKLKTKWGKIASSLKSWPDYSDKKRRSFNHTRKTLKLSIWGLKKIREK